jgi:hypothetical protein
MSFQYKHERSDDFHEIVFEEVCVSVSLLSLSTFSILLVTSIPALAFIPSDSAKQSLKAIRIDGDIELTGTLSDSRWNQAPPAEIRYEVMPGENTPAAVRTTVRILYNSDYVYFGFRCEDTDPLSIRAHITDRDKISDDDRVGIILDTYGDFQRSYEFLLNPYGIQADFLRTGDNEDDSFNAVWKSAATIDASGWTAEMALPFKSLRFPSQREQRWTVLFFRVYPRASQYQISWNPIDRNNPCIVCQGGLLEGITDVESVSSVDVLPYVVAQQSGSLADVSNPQSSFENGKLRGRVGGSIRYSPNPDVDIEAVVNPDFSQVESDATQISVNSTFALNYPEKRPFFLVGPDMYNNQTGTFYSRMINNPIGAARVLGKSGPFSFAYLGAGDRNTPYIVPGEENSNFVATNLESFSNMARARYDFGGETFVGGMLTTRNTATAHNYVGGIDWSYKFLENYYFAGELFYSDTKEVNDLSLNADPRPFGDAGRNAAFNGEQFAGASTLLSLRRGARDWSFYVRYMDRAPTFDAQSGFAPSNDTRILFMEHDYTFYPNNAVIDQWTLGANAGLHFNHENVRKEKWFVPSVSAQLKGQISINASWFLVNDELFHGVQFDNINRAQVSINARPSSSLTLMFDGSFGRFIRRSAAPDMGTGHTIDLTARLRPTSQLQVDLSYSRARLSSVATGTLFYDGYVARILGIYQFTPELFLRVIGQYDHFGKAFDFYPLLSYKLNPFTIFYAGSTYAMSDFGEPFGVKQTARQYFLKLQYLLRS